jgi:hypothetical protein
VCYFRSDSLVSKCLQLSLSISTETVVHNRFISKNQFHHGNVFANSFAKKGSYVHMYLRRTCCQHLQGSSTLSYGVTSQKTVILIFTTTRTSNIIHRYIKRVKSVFTKIHNVLHFTLSFHLKHVSNDELYLKLTYL